MKLSVILLLFFSFAANADQLVFPVDVDAAGKPVLMAEMSGTDLKKSSLFPQPTGGQRNSSEAKFLNQYYRLLVKNDIPGLTKVFYDGDGSKDEFSSQIASNPKRYVGFKQVNKVVGEYLLNWGSYKFVNVTYHTAKKNQRWREFIVCQEKCEMSRAMNHIDETREIFVRLNGQLSKVTRRTKLGELSKQYGSQKKALSNTSIQLFADWSGSPNPGRYPVNVSADVKYFKPLIVPVKTGASKSLAKTNKAFVQPVGEYLKFLSALKKVEIAENQTPKLPVPLANLFNTHWTEFNSNMTIKAYTEKGDKKLGNTSVTAEEFAPVAYARQAQSWETLILVASFDTASHKFLYFYPVVGGEVQTIRAVPFAKTAKGYRLSYEGQRTLAGKLMLTTNMVNHIFNRTSAMVGNIKVAKVD